MIARMSKYDFVLYAAQGEDFVERLRELGLVDITTVGWEPSEEDRQLLLDIEGHAKAAEFLRAFRETDRFDGTAAPYATGAEAYERYVAAQQSAAALRGEIARLEKAADELRPWGAFSVEDVKALAARGIVLRYFSVNRSVYEKNRADWSERYTLEPIAGEGSTVYFVVVAAPDAEVAIDAQEMKSPAMDIREAERRIAGNKAQLAALDADFSRVAVSEKLLASHASELRERLQGVRVKATAQSAADGALAVMEGWAEKETSDKVDALLAEYPNVVYLKSDPTPEDNTPVKLRNNRFARLFELIGGMYALPKYGTVDMTPYFAPFYMLFFAICLNDAGYGLVLLAAGLLLWAKGGKSLAQAANLTMLCGGATVVFGFFSNSFFGMPISSVPLFRGFRFLDFQNEFFSIALALGVVQILFGMLINIVHTSRVFGFRHALGLLGWFVILLAACLAGGLGLLDESWVIPGFTTSSPAFYAALGAGAVLMLFFNSPGKNLFVNFGSGLWNTYNNVTGLLGDVLSYIRLFAIGLSGGVLALVFNRLALGLTGLDGDLSGTAWWVVALEVVGASVILLIGHGINLFMSSISSFVHPMRLTFVEFFKNAGFEMTTRAFEPIRKMEK